MSQVVPGLIKDVTTLTFDCYGTLVDWETGILSAVRSVLSTAGASPADDQILRLYARAESQLEAGAYQPYAGVLREVMLRIGAECNVSLSPDQIDAIARSLPSWRAFPDTIAAMQRLRTRFKLGIISNVDDELFDGTQCTNALPVDWVVTAQQCGSYKPSLNNFRVAMQRHALSPATMLHVAESLYHDVTPCRELGIRSVWVHRRAGKQGSGATFPAEAAPEARVTSLAELADLLGV